MEAVAVEMSSSMPLAAVVLSSLSLILSVVAILVFVWFKAARNMAMIAADKGYTEKKWFHYCF